MRPLLPAMVALIPAIILPGFSFYFDITPKVVLLLMGTAAALLLWNGSLPIVDRTSRWIVYLLVAQIACMGIATAFSTHVALSWNGGNWRRFGMIENAAVLILTLLILVDCQGDADRVETYLRTSAIASIVIAVYGIAQHFGLDPIL